LFEHSIAFFISLFCFFNRRIAEYTNDHVEWHTFAYNGSDVQELNEKLGAELDKYSMESSPNTIRKVDAVVFMCGLNDFKRVVEGNKTPEQFYHDLRLLVNGIHNRFGKECHVILPGLPMHWTTAFPTPLNSLVVKLAQVWDDEKKRLANESLSNILGTANSNSSKRSSGYDGYVHFVDPPPDCVPGSVARDGVKRES
jgi:hypothetical protein